MDVCRACGSDQVKIGVTNIASGATVFPYYCNSCGKVHTQYAKKKVAHQYAIEVAPLEYVYTSTAMHMQRKGEKIECEVCKKPEGELHHWAPTHIFRDESDRWPTSYLCRACHRRWHDLVTPNMGRKAST